MKKLRPRTTHVTTRPCENVVFSAAVSIANLNVESSHASSRDTSQLRHYTCVCTAPREPRGAEPPWSLYLQAVLTGQSIHMTTSETQRHDESPRSSQHRLTRLTGCSAEPAAHPLVLKGKTRGADPLMPSRCRGVTVAGGASVGSASARVWAAPVVPEFGSRPRALQVLTSSADHLRASRRPVANGDAGSLCSVGPVV